MLPHSLGRERLERQFWSLFADRDLVDPSVADIVVDEFERIYRSPGARLAFLASARAIYLEKPFGRGGFYPRLAGLRPPALFVWSSHDRVIPERFRPHVERWLPSAEQVVLEGCGHVPQVERPERTNPLIARFFARADALGPGIAAYAGSMSATQTGSRNGAGDAADARKALQGGGGIMDSLRRLIAGPRAAGRPRRARPRLHPRDAPAPVAAVLAVVPRRGPRPRQHPRGGAGAARRQPLGRQPAGRHVRLHARVQHLLRGRARVPPARPQPRALDARACPTCASSARSPHRTRTRAGRCAPARRVLVYPGGDYEVHRPSWERHKVDFDGRKGFIRLALEEDVPIVPVVVGRRAGDGAVPVARRAPGQAAAGSTSCSG